MVQISLSGTGLPSHNLFHMYLLSSDERPGHEAELGRAAVPGRDVVPVTHKF